MTWRGGLAYDCFLCEQVCGLDKFFCFWMLWVFEDVGCEAFFDNLPFFHDDDVVSDGLNDVHIVADEDVGEVEFFLDFCEEFEDLELDGGIEGRCGFIEDEDFGFDDEGACDSDSLSLTA